MGFPFDIEQNCVGDKITGRDQGSTAIPQPDQFCAEQGCQKIKPTSQPPKLIDESSIGIQGKTVWLIIGKHHPVHHSRKATGKPIFFQIDARITRSDLSRGARRAMKAVEDQRNKATINASARTYIEPMSSQKNSSDLSFYAAKSPQVFLPYLCLCRKSRTGTKVALII